MRPTRTGLRLAALLCVAAGPATKPGRRCARSSCPTPGSTTSRPRSTASRTGCSSTFRPAPTRPWPSRSHYVLDGNWYFGTAADAVAMDGLSGIVVGVGYPSDDWADT